MKITFFLSHPIQYVSPLLRELGSRTDLKVYYYGGESVLNEDVGFGQKISWDIPLLDGYQNVFLKNSSRSNGMNTRFFDAVNWSIFNIIRKSKEEVIILNGWAYLSDWFVLLAAKLFGKKVWMRAEMPWNQELLKPKSLKRSFKFILFKYIIFQFFIDKFLYIGSQNKLYYSMHGIKEEKLIYAPYSVENERFQLQKTDGIEARNKWGIDVDRIVILYSGKLIGKKRPLDLLKAFEQLHTTNAVLFYMGDGPLRDNLEQYIQQNNIQNVIISGFINQSEIGSIYSMADVFVMCSGIGETWGLSVNEAMNFELPVLVSSICGSSFDLIEEGKNGFIFSEGDITTLSKQLSSLVSDQKLRLLMSKHSKEKISHFSHEVTIQNILHNLVSK
jgi:glycosyltransferase involved in cell wall biosynthesis